MGKRSGTGTSRGGAAAGTQQGRIDMGTVKVNGKDAALSGKLVTKWQSGDRAQLEIEIGAQGFLGGRAFGSVVFNIDTATKTARIVSINSMQAFRGQKVGERLYAQAFAAAKQRGVTKFTSDVRVSIPAANAWRRIGKSLGGVTESKSTNDGQQFIGSGNKPVFTINLSRVSQSKLNDISK